MSENIPRAVVGILAYNDKKEVFLATGNKWKGKWIVPGGHLEWGETFVQCAQREMKEETHLDIEDVEFIQLQESIFSEDFIKKKHFVFIDVIAKATTDDVILNEELEEYGWFSFEEAKKLNTYSSTKRFIEESEKRIISLFH